MSTSTDKPLDAAPRTLPSSLDLLHAVRALTDTRLKGRHKNVLAMLCAFRDKNGAITPSMPQLEAATGESRATIFRALGDLTAWGFVVRRHRGRYASPAYDLFVTGEVEDQPSHSETSQPEISHAETMTSHGETTRSQPETTRSHGETLCGSSLRIPSEDLLEGARVTAPSVGSSEHGGRKAESAVLGNDGECGAAWEAWRDGIGRVTGSRPSTLDPYERTPIVAFANAKAEGRRGEALMVWIADTAEAFARAVDPAFGFTPKACKRWLDAGRPPRRAPVVAADDDRRDKARREREKRENAALLVAEAEQATLKAGPELAAARAAELDRMLNRVGKPAPRAAGGSR
jgi:hypothetical protein